MIELFTKQFYKRNSTMLAVGPMSKNCVDATIELSEDHNMAMILIASRRQIDTVDFGGGYVNNWDTELFSQYVKNKSRNKKTYLARDHGGPWQNDLEVIQNLKLDAAMDSAKKSLKTDIDSGFDFIHLDPSIDIHQKVNQKKITERLFDLIAFCNEYAKEKNKKIFYEVGTEEQSGSAMDLDDFEENLIKIFEFCDKNNFDRPVLTVVQSGTKVMETQNVGSLDSPIRFQEEIPIEIQLPKVIEICNKNNIFMKEHNADYLSLESLKWHPKLGIHSANVAPEFGVTESISLAEVLKSNGLNSLLEKFLEISYNSNKWEKWMIKDSNASDYKKSIIAGHYIFSTEEFKELKKIITTELHKRNIALDNVLKESVKKKYY